MLRLVNSGLWFGTVGAAAALLHLLVFELLHRHLLPGLAPELSNALGFAVAFFVSFTGHRLLSFPDTRISLWQSVLRFSGAAIAGFFTNELVFSSLLHFLGMPARPALVIALLVAAGQTFLISRYWAFRK